MNPTLNLVATLIRSFSGVVSSFKRALDALEHYQQELIREAKQENQLGKRGEQISEGVRQILEARGLKTDAESVARAQEFARVAQISEGVRQILEARGLKGDAESVARVSGQMESLKGYTNMLPEKQKEK